MASHIGRIANILARLTRFIPEPAAPKARTTKSFRGLKVGDRLAPLAPHGVGGAEGIAVAPPTSLDASSVLVVKSVNSLCAFLMPEDESGVVCLPIGVDANWKDTYKKLPKARKKRARAAKGTK